MPRFFVPRAELGENFLVLTGENAAHARVLRLKNGDAVTVCDGEGEEWHCVVSDVAPGQPCRAGAHGRKERGCCVLQRVYGLCQGG